LLAVIKIGGSVITDKREPFKIRRNVVRRLTRELKEALHSDSRLKVIIVHGGGSFGHYVALKHLGKGKISSQGFIEIHEAMIRLNTFFVRELRREGVLAETIHTSSAIILKNGEISEANIKTVRGFLENKIVPVLYGDVVYDLVKGFTIVSGDTLAAFLAEKLKANLIAYVTNVNGIYRTYPPKHGLKDLIPQINLRTYNLSGKMFKHVGYDVTGGMAFKLLELKKYISCKHPIKAVIFNGLKKDFLKNILLGKEVKVKTEIKVC